MKFFNSSIFIFLYFLIAAGCNIVNPAEEIPTYIRIDSFRFIGDSSLGTSSQKISNVRVNFDNQTVGIFDLPATIPVLAGKRGVLSLTPGVAYDGLMDVQVSYPFFTTDTITIDPAPGKTIPIQPKTKYYDTSVFGMEVIDFEGRYYPFISLSGDTTHGLDSIDVFEGKYGGQMTLTKKEDMEIMFPKSFNSTSQGFLELNYKCSVPFAVGLQSDNQNNPFVEYIIGVKPSAQWNKIYIALADFIFKYPEKGYRLVIKAMPETDAGGYVALDNVKILRAK